MFKRSYNLDYLNIDETDVLESLSFKDLEEFRNFVEFTSKWSDDVIFLLTDFKDMVSSLLNGRPCQQTSFSYLRSIKLNMKKIKNPEIRHFFKRTTTNVLVSFDAIGAMKRFFHDATFVPHLKKYLPHYLRRLDRFLGNFYWRGRGYFPVSNEDDLRLRMVFHKAQLINDCYDWALPLLFYTLTYEYSNLCRKLSFEFQSYIVKEIEKVIVPLIANELEKLKRIYEYKVKPATIIPWLDFDLKRIIEQRLKQIKARNWENLEAEAQIGLNLIGSYIRLTSFRALNKNVQTNTPKSIKEYLYLEQRYHLREIQELLLNTILDEKEETYKCDCGNVDQRLFTKDHEKNEVICVECGSVLDLSDFRQPQYLSPYEFSNRIVTLTKSICLSFSL